MVDFCSNDYLGFSRLLPSKLKSYPFTEDKLGSTGSRLISGNSEFYEKLERKIASFHNAEAGLIFNSGYDANVGIFSTIPQKGDTILYDSLIHASIRDGIRLSKATSYSFNHNNLEELKSKLEQTTGNIFISIESVYSMDGDEADIENIVKLSRQFNALIIVDEAHSTGTIGNKGTGKCCDLGIEDNIFIRVHTFGKAMGCHGAAVLVSNITRDYLINFCRSFIYTTALPFHNLASIDCAYNILSDEPELRLNLNNKINYFKSMLKNNLQIQRINSNSPIQCIIIKGNENVKRVAGNIQAAGFNVRPIMYPTVPNGEERLRICLHTFNTKEEIKDLTDVIKSNLKNRN